MPATKRGIYHNLRESKYTASNGEVVYFFSSRFYLGKFLDGYQEHREITEKRFERIVKNNPLNVDMLSDAIFYQKVEKRGFYVWIKGVEVDWRDLYQYALQKMTVKNMPGWSEIQRPKLGERLKNMG